MTEVRESCELGASADEVWSVVADFARFAEMLVASRNGNVQISGAGVGMTRTVRVGDDYMVERLEVIDETRFCTSYSMPVTGPFPIADYQATIALTPLAADRSALEWVGSFIASGAGESEAAEAIRAVYVEGIALLHRRFGP
jgi:hypothetical protein